MKQETEKTFHPRIAIVVMLNQAVAKRCSKNIDLVSNGFLTVNS